MNNTTGHVITLADPDALRAVPCPRQRAAAARAALDQLHALRAEVHTVLVDAAIQLHDTGLTWQSAAGRSGFSLQGLHRAAWRRLAALHATGPILAGTCVRCGRVGTRAFIARDGEVWCVNTVACRRRAEQAARPRTRGGVCARCGRVGKKAFTVAEGQTRCSNTSACDDRVARGAGPHDA